MNQHDTSTRPIAVMILGVQRSGTSALTRTLSLGGLDLPNHLLDPNPLNPKGFWESQVFVHHNQGILAALDSDLEDILPLKKNWLTERSIAKLRAELLDAVRGELGGVSKCIVKDPRVCRLFPMWQEILDQLGWDYRIVIPVRHPSEVVGSLKDQGQAAGLRGQLAWLQGFMSAEASTRNLQRSFITFDQLLKDPIGHSRRVSDELDLNLKFGEQAQQEIHEFLDYRPKNRQESEQRDNQIIGLCRRTYRWAESQTTEASDYTEIQQLQSRYNLLVTALKPLVFSRKLFENLRNSKTSLNS